MARAEEFPKPVILTESGFYDLGPHLALLQDKSGVLNQNAPPVGHPNFRSHEGRTPNLGIVNYPVWVKFSLTNPTDQARLMLLSFNYPVTDEVILFIPDQGKYETMTAGDSVTASPRVLAHRNFVFPINVPASGTTTFHMRLRSPAAAMTMPMTLYDIKPFQQTDNRNQMLFGLIFGAVIFFSIYFTAMSFRLREPAEFWFALYITFFGLLMAIRKGYVQHLLGPHLVDLNNLLDILVIGGLYFTGAKLLRSFLKVAFYSRRIDHVLAFLQWLGLAFIPITFWLTVLAPMVGIILFLLGPVFSSGVALFFWLRGVPNARYFALGWLAGHATSVLDCLRISGVIPYEPFMTGMIPVSLTCCLIFYTMAIVEQTYSYKFFADQDGLTGLANRRYFDKLLNTEWLRQQRYHRPLALIMADVDFFKQYNDTYGHRAGDTALVKLAEVLIRFARRPGDLAARYGGEEFVLILAETEPEEAKAVAEKIRSEVVDLKIPHAKGVIDVVSVSLGASVMVPREGFEPKDLLTSADRALYQAKRSGRNRVHMDGA